MTSYHRQQNPYRLYRTLPLRNHRLRDVRKVKLYRYSCLPSKKGAMILNLSYKGRKKGPMLTFSYMLEREFIMVRLNEEYRGTREANNLYFKASKPARTSFQIRI